MVRDGSHSAQTVLLLQKLQKTHCSERKEGGGRAGGEEEGRNDGKEKWEQDKTKPKKKAC